MHSTLTENSTFTMEDENSMIDIFFQSQNDPFFPTEMDNAHFQLAHTKLPSSPIPIQFADLNHQNFNTFENSEWTDIFHDEAKKTHDEIQLQNEDEQPANIGMFF